MHSDRAYVDEAIKIGVNGYVGKRNAGADLLIAVRAVLAGETYFPN
jgi:DNA-binding NarL/FixJ family response regulator